MSMRSRLVAALSAAIFVIAVPIAAIAQPASAGSPTFDGVRARGQVVCGTAADLPSFASVDSQGQWRGLFVDVCRAVAAAALGDAAKVRFVPTRSKRRDSRCRYRERWVVHSGYDDSVGADDRVNPVLTNSRQTPALPLSQPHCIREAGRLPLCQQSPRARKRRRRSRGRMEQNRSGRGWQPCARPLRSAWPVGNATALSLSKDVLWQQLSALCRLSHSRSLQRGS